MDINPTPLELKFEFHNVRSAGQYWFAKVSASMAPDNPAIGIADVVINIPLASEPQGSLPEIRRQVLECARQLINEDSMRLLLQRPLPR
jgi:hypothetical protein